MEIVIIIRLILIFWYYLLYRLVILIVTFDISILLKNINGADVLLGEILFDIWWVDAIWADLGYLMCDQGHLRCMGSSKYFLFLGETVSNKLWPVCYHNGYYVCTYNLWQSIIIMTLISHIERLVVSFEFKHFDG